ncbi:hypothetical protein BD289DRAFT_486280 [Coniella lustricola]|uniref:Uncharacterized protein n=1 Tax=Coniella lustricola TaxID=2025994 RepID=A0A2T2ZVN6_9PEZI|nr:hypothetical protein BD289DRAFT_486280 [Coniella lustricola]
MTLGGGDSTVEDTGARALYHEAVSSIWRDVKKAEQLEPFPAFDPTFGVPSEERGNTAATAPPSVLDDSQLTMSTEIGHNYIYLNENEDRQHQHGREDEDKEAADRAMSQATMFGRASQMPPPEMQTILHLARLECDLAQRQRQQQLDAWVDVVNAVGTGVDTGGGDDERVEWHGEVTDFRIQP